MVSAEVLGDIKSLVIFFGIIILAGLFMLSLIATVGMISFMLSGQFLESAPILASCMGCSRSSSA